jgi:DNA polymerase delta subunit 1
MAMKHVNIGANDLRAKLFHSHTLLFSQLEVDITYTDIISRKSEGKWNKMAPLRVLSFDIECQGRKGHFPEAEMDPVIQIANTVSVYGQDNPAIQNVFTLKGCLPIVGAQVISSDKEDDMLVKWRAFLEASDPDIITGYNVQNFDIPYLLDRAEQLRKEGSRNVLDGFAQWGRIRNVKARMKASTFQSSAYGKRNNVETTINGRVIFDMLPFMQRNHNLSSYTLNAVCAEFLSQQKEDVHHSIIADLQNGSDEDRHRLAVYCLKDALLPQRLMDKLSVLVNYIEMARVTGVPVSFLISRGQQIKVFSMILRKTRIEKLLVPTLQKTGQGGPDAGYEGATVLDPIKVRFYCGALLPVVALTSQTFAVSLTSARLVNIRIITKFPLLHSILRHFILPSCKLTTSVTRLSSLLRTFSNSMQQAIRKARMETSLSTRTLRRESFPRF